MANADARRAPAGRDRVSPAQTRTTSAKAVPLLKSPPSSPPVASACSSAAPPTPQARHTSRHVRLQNLRRRATFALMALRTRAMDCPVNPDPESQTASLVKRLAEITAMTTGELRAEFQRLSGRPTGSWNRDWMRRKVSWLIQEQERQRSDTVGVPTLVPEVRDQPRSVRLDAPISVLPGRGVRDPRRPKPGSVIVRPYRGLRLTVTVLERGFEWNGQIYPSLSALASAVTGTHWNGRLFFGLSRRKRGSK